METGREVMNRIDGLLQEREWSYSDLARASGIALSTITTWKYKDRVPKAGKLEDIAKALDVDAGYLLRGDRAETEPQKLAAWIDTMTEDEKETLFPAIMSVVKLYCETKKVPYPLP